MFIMGLEERARMGTTTEKLEGRVAELGGASESVSNVVVMSRSLNEAAYT